MKKLFLFAPAGLLAATGIALIGLEYSNPDQNGGKSPKSPEELFTQSQNSLRSIIRHGDKNQVSVLNSTLKNLESSLSVYEKKGLNIDKVEQMIERYANDSLLCAKATEAYAQKIKTSEHYEQQNGEKFNVALEQIGLFELTEANKRLDKKRLDYIKEPTLEHKEEYLNHVSLMKQTIVELYLDSEIEKPLYSYLDNHKGYFETIVSVYDKAGNERVNRIQNDAYAIKTELQMLPKI